jgi:DnaA family protein
MSSGQLILALAPPPAPSFANFRAGANAAALRALTELAEGNAADPVIYLWGGAGAGRSHLAEATVHAASAAGRPAVLARPGRLPAADARCTLLVVDDADALAPDEQIACFDLFNALRARGGGFVATGARPPADLALRDDLRTRIASGVTFELRPLDDAARLSALRAHAHERGLAVPDEVFEYVARRVPRDMRTQMTVLDALDRLSLAEHRPLTLPLAREALLALVDPGAGGG